jgi:triphosphoribosyl-dephospho-CoA synthase
VTDIARAFLAACEAELTALKPGNVHAYAAGHGMTVEDFRRSAVAAAPAIAAAGAPVGQRVRRGVEATRAAVGQNTNLGILLLCAPLAAAAEQAGGQAAGQAGGQAGGLRARTSEVLRSLTLGDARDAFAAIVQAGPGGLGRADEADVRQPPTVTLLEAMALAAARDRIAWNYAHGFQDVFRRGLPRLRALRRRGWPQPWAVSGLFMALLAAVPDSHVARRHGSQAAMELRARARPQTRALLAAGEPSAFERDLLLFDADLKQRGLNPGTTADLTVACLFADGLDPDRAPTGGAG